MDIKIIIGDKVIRADGLAGNVVEIVQSEYGKYRLFYYAKMENGDTETIVDDEEVFGRFYLIGKTILGNKVPLDQIDEQIDELKARIKLLRKQRWRLDTQMNGDFVPQNQNEED